MSYLWNFGDSSIPNSSLGNPVVTFSHSGTYTVSLTVTDANGLSDPSPATRQVTVGSSGGALPRSGWSVVYVDSEETNFENSVAENMFDGDPSTYWHSAWSQGVAPLPHEVRIDLGQTYTVSGFRYLPRQGVVVNGRIGSYEFYVSADGVSWGTAVAAGVFPNAAAQQTVNFSSKSGRYVRLRALSEVNGNPWTSVAELDVLGFGP